MMKRRTAIIGLGGLLGLSSYHQRRRLLRWSDRSALHDARQMDIPHLTHSSHLQISDVHLSDAWEALQERVTTARDLWPNGVETDRREIIAHTDDRLESAEETLANTDSDSFPDSDTARADLLSELRFALSAAEQAVALAELDRGDRTPDDISVATEAVDDTYRATIDNLTYPANDINWAIAAYSQLDEILDDARGSISMADEYARGEPQHAAARLTHARARLDDVSRIADTLANTTAGSARDDDLETLYNSLSNDIETTLDSLDGDTANDVPSYASKIISDSVFGTLQVNNKPFDQGLLALAVRNEFERYMAARSAEAFTDIPRPDRLENPTEHIQPSGSEVRRAKRQAISELTARLEADGDDPLVRYTCVTIADDLEWQNTQIDRVLEGINTSIRDEWVRELDSIRLACLDLAKRAVILHDVSLSERVS